MNEAPWPAFGITTRFASHVPGVPLAFWETKDVTGAVRNLAAGAVPSVSLFADNRLAAARPDWVQVDGDGVRAERGGAPYFDWAVLCPSRPEVVQAATVWVDDAVRAQSAALAAPSLRLGDAGFAREGFCRCAVCLAETERRGLEAGAYRLERTAELVAHWRTRVAGRLYLTVYPDPYPGHLERRFGLDPGRLAPWVDAFVVPIYDLAYATTHWLETLCQGFCDRFGSHPFYVELYALGVEEARLAKALEVAAAYATGVLLAYERDGERLGRLATRFRPSGAGES